MAESQTGISYHIIISGMKKESDFPSAATKFAQTFNLTPEVSEQILKSIPVVFLTNLPRSEIKIIKPNLIKLSESGIEFTTSVQLPPTIPRVIWPSPPHYKEGPAGEMVQYVDFQWRGSAFVCPNCGETFVFQRVGNPFKHYQEAKERMPAVTLTPVEAVETVESEEVSAEEEGEVMELAPIVEPQTEWTDENASEPIDILEPAAEESPAEEAVAEAPEIVEEPVVEETNCNVFLSGLSSAEKRDAAAKIIAEVKNLPLEKAKELTNRVLVPVLKEVTETEASDCLERFKKIGISGRITKK